MPCYNTVKKIFEIKIEQYYLELTNIEFIDPVLNDMITNAQKHSIIPNLNETSLFKIYCTLALDACKITNPFIPSDDPVTSQTQNDVILSKKDELESLKQEVGFLDTESLCGLTPIQL